MIINLKSQTDLSGFYIIFRGATNLESRGIYGISHLMEHLICKNFDHLRDEFEKTGVEWNAYTNQNEIVFFFLGLDKFVSKRRTDLVDLITDFRINKQQFETERKVVVQEYKNSFSDQSSNHLYNLNRKLFRNFGAIGLKEDLESLSFMDCMNFFEKQFKSPSKIINVSKNSPFSMDVDFSENIVDNKIEFGPYKDVILETKKRFGDKVSLAAVSKISEEDFDYITFINNMLSLGLSSPLYTEIREKRGLVYNISCHQTRINGQGVTVINTETSNNNSDEVFDLLKNIINNPNKFMTKKRFDLIKNSYLIKFQKDKIMRYQNVNHWINPKGWSVKDIINTITYEKVMDVYDTHYNFDDFYLSNDSTEFT